MFNKVIVTDINYLHLYENNKNNIIGLRVCDTYEIEELLEIESEKELREHIAKLLEDVKIVIEETSKTKDEVERQRLNTKVDTLRKELAKEQKLLDEVGVLDDCICLYRKYVV